MTGKRILAMREAYQMSQEEMAQLLGVVMTTVSRWERNNCAPRGRAQRHLLQIMAMHQRDAEPRRQQLRSTLRRATELGLNVPVFLFGGNAQATPERVQELHAVAAIIAKL